MSKIDDIQKRYEARLKKKKSSLGSGKQIEDETEMVKKMIEEAKKDEEM